jgi:hypothetical protein
MPTEIIVDYQAPGMSPSLSVFYFEAPGAESAARDALRDMFVLVEDYLSEDLNWTVRTTGRVLDSATGQLSGEWSDPNARAGFGASVDNQVANATCMLMRWNTGDIVRGRFVRGRTFVPGLRASALVNGQWASSAAGAFGVAGQALITSGTGFGVWHRPTGGSGGSFHAANNCTGWTEAAMQRRRR